jgi:hypothetical protein
MILIFLILSLHLLDVLPARFQHRTAFRCSGADVVSGAPRLTESYEKSIPITSFRLSSDALPYSPLWYRGPNAIRDAIGHAKHQSRSHDALIRVYDDAGNVIETHEHNGDFKDW